jgi:prophage regulatory protein
METKANRQGELPLEEPKRSVQTKPPRILRLAQVRAMTGLGRSFIYQLQAQKLFPQRIKIGLRAVGWVEDEVERWVADRIAQSRTNNDVAGDS